MVEDLKKDLCLIHRFHLDPMNSRWFRPPPGYYKLNVDGSYREGKATNGGVLGDVTGQWVWRFTGCSGCTSTLHAELMGLGGLTAICDRNLLRVIIETDSAQVVKLVNDFLEEEHPYFHIILACKRLHRLNWSCHITYVPRNYKKSADCITKLGHSVCANASFVWFDVAPPAFFGGNM